MTFLHGPNFYQTVTKNRIHSKKRSATRRDQFGIQFKQAVVSINNSLLPNNGRKYGSDKGKEEGLWMKIRTLLY
jgi:hypothetical protein